MQQLNRVILNSSVSLFHHSNEYFITFIVFSTSMLFIYLCTAFIKRIIQGRQSGERGCKPPPPPKFLVDNLEGVKPPSP